MTKKELRKKYKELRKSLSTEDIVDLSIAIANQILKLPIWDKKNFHVFLPIEHQKEIDTQYILHVLHGKDKNVILSQSNFEDLSMKHFLLDDQITIKTNEWGIPEPINGIPIADELIDVVFVPLLAYDLKGHRVGYGKGFYDRFLSKCRKDVITIGLSFYAPEIQIDDASEWDVQLHYIVSPNEITKIVN